MPQQEPLEAPRKKAPRRGPRAKHIPRRMCVACRESDEKRSLTRIVRTPEGMVEIDLTGKRNGRGAYLCERRTCWERAISTPILARALNTELSDETRSALREFADGLSSPPTDEARMVNSEEPRS